jgi:hypothetical protein
MKTAEIVETINTFPLYFVLALPVGSRGRALYAQPGSTYGPNGWNSTIFLALEEIGVQIGSPLALARTLVGG